MSLPLLETIIVAAAVAVLASYHVWFFNRMRRRPERTVLGIALEHRRRWVERVVTRNDGILAVQTLRNWVMAASFLASAAIILAVGLLGVLFNADMAPALVHKLNLIGATTDTLVNLKLLLLVALFSLGFFSFSLTIRYFNHAALIINSGGPDDAEKVVSTSLRYINRGAWHYTLGMRAFYLAIPVTLWLFGPIWLGIGAVALTGLLFIHDRAG